MLSPEQVRVRTSACNARHLNHLYKGTDGATMLHGILLFEQAWTNVKEAMNRTEFKPRELWLCIIYTCKMYNSNNLK